MTPPRRPVLRIAPILRRVVVAGLVGASSGCAWSGAPAPGFCAAPESTWFACATSGGRQLALCGEAGRGLQYRFGRPPKADLQFPDRAADGLSQLLHAHYFRAGVDRTEIRFTRAETDYVVFDYTEDGHRNAGVRVTTPDGRETEVACHGAITSRLAELGPRLPCDTDSALNGGQCPAR